MFIYKEMKTNAAGPLVQIMRDLNQDGPAGMLAAYTIWTSQMMDTNVKEFAGPFVPQLANWDHKPILTNEKRSPVPEIPVDRPEKPRGWSTIGSSLYRFDIWSNIHYGYVGRASGFSQPELTGGAGIEQIGSDVYHGNMPHRSGEADNWASSWDDPSDNAAILIGAQLWDQYGLAVTPADLYLAVLDNSRLAIMPLGGAP